MSIKNRLDDIAGIAFIAGVVFAVTWIFQLGWHLRTQVEMTVMFSLLLFAQGCYSQKREPSFFSEFSTLFWMIVFICSSLLTTTLFGWRMAEYFAQRQFDEFVLWKIAIAEVAVTVFAVLLLHRAEPRPFVVENEVKTLYQEDAFRVSTRAILTISVSAVITGVVFVIQNNGLGLFHGLISTAVGLTIALVFGRTGAEHLTEAIYFDSRGKVLAEAMQAVNADADVFQAEGENAITVWNEATDAGVETEKLQQKANVWTQHAQLAE